MTVETKCGGCCVNDQNCQGGCKKCLPMNLCVDVQGTAPGGGCFRFSFRANYQCDSRWEGQGFAVGHSDIFLAVTIWAEFDGTDCTTFVSFVAAGGLTGTGTGSDHATLSFNGFLPDDMTFTAVDNLGDRLDATISNAFIIQNPVYFDRCSPCKCSSCIPKRFCLTLARVQTLTGTGSGPIPCLESVTATYTYDCPTRSWIGNHLVLDGRVFNITMALLPVESEICGVSVSILDSPFGTGTGSVSGTSGGLLFAGHVTFEEPALCCDGTLKTWKYGIKCGGNGVVTIIKPDCKNDPTIDEGCFECPAPPPPDPHPWSTFLTTGVGIPLGDGHLANFQLTIASQECGSCPENNVINDSTFCTACPGLPERVLLTVTPTNPPCTPRMDPVVLHYDRCNQRYRGYVDLNCPGLGKPKGVYAWDLLFEGGLPPELRLSQGTDVRVLEVMSIISCAPFECIGTFNFAGDALCPLPDCPDPSGSDITETWTTTFTITAAP